MADTFDRQTGGWLRSNGNLTVGLAVVGVGLLAVAAFWVLRTDGVDEQLVEASELNDSSPPPTAAPIERNVRDNASSMDDSSLVVDGLVDPQPDPGAVVALADPALGIDDPQPADPEVESVVAPPASAAPSPLVTTAQPALQPKPDPKPAAAVPSAKPASGADGSKAASPVANSGNGAAPAPPVNPSAEYKTVKALVDKEWALNNNASDWYTVHPMKSDDGYFSQPVLIGAAQYYKATGDTTKLDIGIRIGQNWIDSGADENGDGYLDWWGERENYGPLFNYHHHEFRAAMGIADVLIEMKRTGYEGGKTGRIDEWTKFLAHDVWAKWDPELKQVSGGGDIWVDYRNTTSSYSAGRWALIAMALNQTHATPGSNEYFTWLNNPSTPFVEGVSRYVSMHANGKKDFPRSTNKDNEGAQAADTSHTGDFLYPVTRAKQIGGYTFNGKLDQFLAAYEAHLNDNWFPTSEGFTEYADGSGNVNGWHLSSSPWHGLSAGLSPELKARWVDYVVNHEPTFTFYKNTGHNKYQATVLGGTLMWVLAGNSLD